MSKTINKKAWYIHPFVEIKSDPMVDLGIHLKWCKEIGVDIEGVVIGKKINQSYFDGLIGSDRIYNVLYHQIESEIPVWRKLSNFIFRLLNTFKIISLIKRKCLRDSIAFFISFDPLFFSIISMLCPKLNYILFVHYTQIYKNRFIKKICSCYFNRIKYIFVVEEEVKRELCKIFKNLSLKIVVVEKMDFDAKYTSNNPKRTKSKTRFLFPGAIRVAKGILIYLKAIQSLNGREGMKFLLAGAVEGSNKTIIHNEILKTKELLEESFIFNEKQLSNDQYYESLKEADYLVLPYLKEFYVGRASSVVYDAIKVGVPIIAPDFGMFKDYISMFGIGLFFKAEDPMSLAEIILYASKTNLSFDDSFTKAYKEFSEEKFRIKFCKAFEVSAKI